MSERGRVLAALAIGSIAIGFAAIFFRLASPTDPLLASMLRLGIAGVLLSPFTVRAVRDGSLSPRAVKVGVGCGVVYAVHFGTWVASLERTTVAASVTLVTATPLMLAVVAFVRGRDRSIGSPGAPLPSVRDARTPVRVTRGEHSSRDRPTTRTTLAIVAATLGALLIGASDASEARDGAVIGDVLALTGAAAMVVYLLAVRDLGEVPALAFSGVATLSGAVVLALVLPIEHAMLGGLAWPDATALGFIVLAALIPQVVGHGALTWALRRASPTEVGLATAAEPVISTALAAWVFAERPTLLVLVGAAITLTAVVVGVARREGADPSASR